MTQPAHGRAGTSLGDLACGPPGVTGLAGISLYHFRFQVPRAASPRQARKVKAFIEEHLKTLGTPSFDMTCVKSSELTAR